MPYSHQLIEKIPVSVKVIHDHYASQVGAAIADDEAKTAAEMFLRVRLRAYEAYAYNSDPKVFITAIVSEGAKPQGFLALVAEVDSPNNKIDVVKNVRTRIDEALRDAHELHERKLRVQDLPEGEEKIEKIKAVNALPIKLKNLEKELPNLKLAATQIHAESPDAIDDATKEFMEKLSIETSDLKASPTNEDVVFLAKVSSMANGSTTVNIQNKGLGFETLTIKHMVGDEDVCDFFLHACVNKNVFEVTLVLDNELAGATARTHLAAKAVKFPFSKEDIIKAIVERNSKKDEQIMMDFDS